MMNNTEKYFYMSGFWDGIPCGFIFFLVMYFFISHVNSKINKSDLNSPKKVSQEWIPKIGEKVKTNYRTNSFGGPYYITTVTNIINVGQRSNSGLLIYGKGLPGVDLWWVDPVR